MRSCRLRLACSFVLLAGAGVVAGCAAEKSANPLSPSVAGPIPGVGITAPSVVTPTVGSRIKDSSQPIKLTVGNSTTTGVRPLSYHFQLASDSGFKHKLFDQAGISPGSGGHTSATISDSLASDTYYWRARAEDGANSSAYSGTFSFEVYTPVVLGTPGPISPINGTALTDTSATLTFSNASHSGPAGQITYDVQYSTSSGFGGAKTVHKAEQSGQTSVSVSSLTAQKTYYWRARATDPGSDTTGDWSSTASFKTGGTTDDGGGGGGGGGPVNSNACGNPSNGQAVIDCIASQYPEKLVSGISLSQRKDNMAFLRDKIIAMGNCNGMDLAWNLKRGGPELSIDFVTAIVGGQLHGIDIAHDYDNTGHSLELQWSDAGPPSISFAVRGGKPSYTCQ